MEENLIILNINELDKLLSKYFKTLEQQEKDNKLLQENKEKFLKQLEENKKVKEQELQDQQTSSLDFQDSFIQEIKVIQENIQLSNNLSYFTIIALSLAFLCTLFYKFLNNFI